MPTAVDDAEPHGVPRDAAGGPIRSDAAAHERLRRGIHPDRISASWPVIGEPIEQDGRMLHPVTFVAEAVAGHEVMVHLNGVTDAHRENIVPALMEPVAGGRHALTYLLPADLRVSYRFAADASLPRDAGRTREGWRRIHELGRTDPRNPDTIPNPLGTMSSVLTMPRAPRHPAWDAAAVDEPPLSTVHLSEHAATVVHGDPSRVLMLFDGEWWEQLGIAAALVRVGGPTTVLVPSGSLARRAQLLPDPERLLPHLLDEVVPAVAAVIGGWDAARTVVAGQSLGGLAAALTVCLRPDIAGTAIVQSGSFPHRAGQSLRPPAGQVGDLVRSLAGSRIQGRFLVQAGTEEPALLPAAEAFTAAARRAGGDAALRVYTGGHDFAWWRIGLFDALDAL
ncbi:enterochelin esterase domain-containing protein [Microbacterium protaetiae]|nr:enterochelin esterase domain-containing protein [Microbacterium protaetiae]